MSKTLAPTPWMDKLEDDFDTHGARATAITVSPDVQVALNKEHGEEPFYQLALGKPLLRYAGVPITAYRSLPPGTLTVVR